MDIRLGMEVEVVEDTEVVGMVVVEEVALAAKDTADGVVDMAATGVGMVEEEELEEQVGMQVTAEATATEAILQRRMADMQDIQIILEDEEVMLEDMEVTDMVLVAMDNIRLPKCMKALQTATHVNKNPIAKTKAQITTAEEATRVIIARADHQCLQLVQSATDRTDLHYT